MKPSWLHRGSSLLWMIMLICLPACDSRESAHDPTPWFKDYQAALAQAQDSGKLIFLNFTADWCPPCQEMKKKTFPDPALQQILQEKFVLLKVDLTQPDSSQNALSQQYGIQYIPTLVIASADGRTIAQRSGFVAAADMRAWLQKAVP